MGQVLPVILIGPMRAGKSTQAALVSTSLGLERVSTDEVRWRYYAEAGWSKDEQERIRAESGFLGVSRYWQRFNLHLLRRVLEDHQQAVIDFGAGLSMYDDPRELTRAKRLLQDVLNVILLLPSSDKAESIRLLRDRIGEDPRKLQHLYGANYFDFTTYYVTSPSNYTLATHIVYTDGKTPEETTEEILSVLNRTT